MVSEAMKTQNADVATVLRTARQAGKDMTHALDAVEERMTGPEKISTAGKVKSSARVGQIGKNAQMFVDKCSGGLRLCHVKVQVFSDIRSGKKDDRNPRMVKQPHLLAVGKATAGPQLMAQIHDNHKRIPKSAPKEALDGLMTSGEGC